MGFKVSDYLITVDGDELVAARTDGEAISVTRSASFQQLKNSRYRSSKRELIVLVTGSGSRLLSATFDEMPESAANVIENFSVKLVNSEARTVEIFDKDTGHSIANRVLEQMIKPKGWI